MMGTQPRSSLQPMIDRQSARNIMTRLHAARRAARGGVLVALCVLAGAAQAATRVELVVDEPYDDRAAAWPVTTGVPFPRGKLAGEEHCRLVDETGAEQPLQARVAATWD